MMNALPAVPRRITPASFYQSYVTTLFEVVTTAVAWPAWRWSFTVMLTDTTETFTLRFDNGELSVNIGSSRGDLPLFVARLDSTSWSVLVHEVLPEVVRYLDRRRTELERDLQAFARRQAEKLFDPNRLRALDGTVRIVYTDDAGDMARVDVAVAGCTAPPRAEVLVDDSDLWAWLESKGQLTALLRSRLRVEGDATYVLQLARAVEG